MVADSIRNGAKPSARGPADRWLQVVASVATGSTPDGQVPMPTLELSPSEQALLREVLESAVSDLGMEISATDAKDYRDDLKQRREVLHRVIAALGGRVPSA